MTIRAGILGMGWWGRTLVDSVQGADVMPSEAIRFVAGATRTPAKVTNWAAERDIAVEEDLDARLARDDLDAIAIVTPHSQHSAQIKAVAATGRHVFCEKPLASAWRRWRPRTWPAMRWRSCAWNIHHGRRRSTRRIWSGRNWKPLPKRSVRVSRFAYRPATRCMVQRCLQPSVRRPPQIGKWR